MYKIICFVNLFKANARVYSFNEDANHQTFICEVPIDDMAECLAEISSTNNINNVTLIGATLYSQEIAPMIVECAKTKFSNNDLIVEVME